MEGGRLREGLGLGLGLEIVIGSITGERKDNALAFVSALALGFVFGTPGSALFLCVLFELAL